MLVNASNSGHVEFVSYDGKYPNLCSGTLHLKIDGKSFFFGPDKPFDIFWSSGGHCGFRNGEALVTHGEWKIDVDDLPDELKPYTAEIDEVFNDNVRQGCCGGCI